MSDPHPSAAAPPPLTPRRRIFEIALLLCGVVLPLVTLAVELTTRMNSEIFFNPLPTAFHVLLVALVPGANLAAWLAIRRKNSTHVRKLAFANGCAIGIASFYTLLFLPLSPFAAIAIIYFGIGLLPLTPLIALIASIRIRVHLSQLAGPSQKPLRLWPGIAVGLLALLVLEIPATLTRLGMQMATADLEQTRTRGIRWLRVVGDEDLLLRLCYVRSGATTDMVSFVFSMARPVSTENAREIYYRVTGAPFNSVPAPREIRGRDGFFDGPNWDFDQGEDGVGGRLQGLSLAASRLDGSLDGDAALGYLEWTMVFRNDTHIPREARAQIALPPGGVVSRLTLWIDGEEREAAFAGRGKVRQAYQNVVMRNRDPVLVTTAGQDRISMQLFPVPPSGEMKVRVGMTVPLSLRSRHEGMLSLPYFHERNFDVDPHLRHSLWIDSKTPLRGELAAPSRVDNVFAFRADLEDANLGLAASSIIVERNEQDESWAVDTKVNDHLVRQVLSDRAALAPKRLIVVVDGSKAMQDAASDIAKAFAGLPQDIELTLLIAHDGVIEHGSVAPLAGSTLAQQLERFDYDGGNDNTEALARGLDLALAQENTGLLWIHGPQPVLLETAEPLLQRLQRRPQLPVWYELQVQPGVNLIGEKLDGFARLVSLREEDLQPLILSWRRGARQIVVQRERIKVTDTAVLQAENVTSDHLVRLWANDEITRLALSRGAEQRQDAIMLAQQYQLVTPVSGAVVLENQQQYRDAGLEPVAPGTVPTIPEPETWALIVIVIFVCGYSYRRWRRSGIRVQHAI